MLTDYHVHLRPDEPGTTAERYFTAANAERYREAASERGIAELGVSEHVYRFTAALDVWQHPFWRQRAADDLDAYCEFVREETDLRLGIEADFVPGREDRMANLLEAREWDYVIGSVHFLRDHAVDMDGSLDVWGRGESADQVWRRYFETLAEAARSGLYDIIAHPDLVKVWGGERAAPGGRPAPLLRAGRRGVRRGRRRRRGLDRRAAQAGRRDLPRAARSWRWSSTPAARSRSPATPTSPEQLGYGYERGARAARRRSASRELCVFEGRQRRLEPIG